MLFRNFQFFSLKFEWGWLIFTLNFQLQWGRLKNLLNFYKVLNLIFYKCTHAILSCLVCKSCPFVSLYDVSMWHQMYMTHVILSFFFFNFFMWVMHICLSMFMWHKFAWLTLPGNLWSILLIITLSTYIF